MTRSDWKLASRSRGTWTCTRPHLGQHSLGAGAVAQVAGPTASLVVLVTTDLIADLTLDGGLHQPLGKPGQHRALAGERQPTSLRAIQQLRDELLVQPVGPASGFEPSAFSTRDIMSAIRRTSMIGSNTTRLPAPGVGSQGPLPAAKPYRADYGRGRLMMGRVMRLGCFAPRWIRFSAGIMSASHSSAMMPPVLELRS